MNCIKAVSPKNHGRQHYLPEQRTHIFDYVTDSTACFRQGVPIDVDPFYYLMPTSMALAARADYGDIVACLLKGSGLIPNPAIKRNGQVLDDYQDPISEHGYQQIP